MTFNHFTMNTEHNCIQDTTKFFLDENLQNYVKKIITDMHTQQSKIDLFDGITASGRFFKDAYCIALWREPFKRPFLVSSGAINDAVRKKVWKCLKFLYNEYIHSTPSVIIPKAPYVCDLVVLPCLDAIPWTGDFTRCAGAATFYEMQNGFLQSAACFDDVVSTSQIDGATCINDLTHFFSIIHDPISVSHSDPSPMYVCYVPIEEIGKLDFHDILAAVENNHFCRNSTPSGKDMEPPLLLKPFDSKKITLPTRPIYQWFSEKTEQQE